MAQPKGSRTRVKPSEEPTELKQIERTCIITGKPFQSYMGALPISKVGWIKLSDKQKYLIAQGVSLEEVLKQ